MTASVDGLAVRRVMGRRSWSAPTPFGPDGWRLDGIGGVGGSVIVTASPHDGVPVPIVHASIAYDDRMPDYADLARLHRAVFGDGYAYQVFVGGPQHVNICATALHLWGRADGAPLMVEFGLDLGNGRFSI